MSFESTARYELTEAEPRTSRPDLNFTTAKRWSSTGLQQLVQVKFAERCAPNFERLSAALTEEARTLAGLNHPNVASLIEFFEDAQGLHLMVEHTPGLTIAQLCDRLESKGLAINIPVAVFIVIELLRVLDDLHSCGLVHLGIRPNAVTITRWGTLKLGGFEHARLKDATAPFMDRDIPEEMIRYLPPEVIAAEPTIVQSDVHAVGALFYELLAAEPCYPGKTQAEVLERIVHRGPGLHALKNQIPGPLIDVLAEAIAFVPEHRYSSAAVMRRVLERWLLEQGLRVTKSALSALVERYSELNPRSASAPEAAAEPKINWGPLVDDLENPWAEESNWTEALVEPLDVEVQRRHPSTARSSPGERGQRKTNGQMGRGQFRMLYDKASIDRLAAE